MALLDSLSYPPVFQYYLSIKNIIVFDYVLTIKVLIT